MGLFDFLGGIKGSGKDTGNALGLNAEDASLAQGQLGNALRSNYNQNEVSGGAGVDTATNRVQNNSILGQIFGQNGTLGRTANEEKDLAARGYSLKPEDYEAYGQASDQIARNFGGQEQGLAEALSQRGLSSSGLAGQSFSGLQGNKMEQLGQMQRQIANDRMKSNMDRLGQTRSFLSNLGQQGENAIQNQYGNQVNSEKMNWQQMMDKNNMAQSRLTGMQNQANEQLGQRQKTAEQPMWASALQGLGNAGERGAMAWGTGGMSEAGGALSGKGAPQMGSDASQRGWNGMTDQIGGGAKPMNAKNYQSVG